jgi:tyrosyl-tRNA synthetase
MKRLQDAGNIPIVLLGGGTGVVGDPSGRNDMRKMLTPEDIEHNCACFAEQIGKFLDFSEGKAIIANNADWLLSLNYVDLLREVGAHFSVNRMLAAECYKQRMEKGLTFFEFNYMIMQSYDFLVLFNKYNCVMQCGGDDQWSNILAGTELIRRKLGKDAYAITAPLLMTSDGRKMGKTQAGAVWLDEHKTSAYDFFQYWRNVDDADVINLLLKLTFLPVDEIRAMSGWTGSDLNKAKELLAYELTKQIHGEAAADAAKSAASALFGGAEGVEIPQVALTAEDFADGLVDIVSLLVKSGLCDTRSDARRQVEQGGVSVDDAKITDFKQTFTQEQVSAGLLIKKGKKSFKKVTM